ncbi:MAG TPA: AtpZ/AtpI family protein [Acidimicrobiales bacterium]|jgi:Putative F0F1-ATPase subunit Ca2+/Mg2+ transporter|nr:AtpZ/AtpI family protein [Acidimicrobiales bacterium]
MSGPASGQGTPGPDDKGPSPERYPGPMVYAGIGMMNAICLLLGGFLGWLVDHELGTLPLFMLIGLLAGAALGVVATRSELRRYRGQG